jgi:hypothetical protein
VRYVAELRLGRAYGPDQPVRLIAATDEPNRLKPDSTWFMATNFPLGEASPAEVYELYRLRDWIEHYYKPAKHELGWADFQVRPEQAIVRHWQLVILAFTFSLLVGAPPPAAPGQEPVPPDTASGGKTVAAEVASRRVGELRPTRLQVGEVLAPPEAEAPHLGLALLVGAERGALLLPGQCRHSGERLRDGGFWLTAGGRCIGREPPNPNDEAV